MDTQRRTSPKNGNGGGNGNGNERERQSPPPPPPRRQLHPGNAPAPPLPMEMNLPGGAGTPPPASEAVPVDADPVGSPEDTAETAAAAVYLVTGVATGEMAEATPSAAEHRAFVRVLGAYFRAKGWKTVGIYAVGAALTAYLIRLAMKPKFAEKIKRWRESWGSKADPLATAKTVKSVPMPMPSPRTPADAAPFTASANHDPFSGSHL
ncbi:hypothetical protein Ga0100231_005305 [Opitutaceae bacterium TAV4]|nr:hypothetical protein Ga0100231_005305 [Opitutaceae bacterium TAV4]